ncbi:MAG TPA: hypothetical protein VK843_19290 [Planctomycetota bacterium]|nr:hypothetical protein [Planctomycetota bacterium]
MRAGPLSDPETIRLLASFECVWILARDVKRIAKDSSAPEELRVLAAGLAERYAYPVDTQLIASDGRLLGQMPVKQLFSAEGMDYPRALRDALAATSAR